jgi:hypothetical protein
MGVKMTRQFSLDKVLAARSRRERYEPQRPVDARPERGYESGG